MNEQRAQLAVTVAALFLAACQEKGSAPPAPTMALPKAAEGKVHCLGIHECKGKSACHVAGGHACAGQNECKGKGWIDVPEAECTERGGKILEG